MQESKLLSHLDTIKKMPHDTQNTQDQEQYTKDKEQAKSFFEDNKGFMIKNRYQVGNVIFYPTSPKCIKTMRARTHETIN